MSVYDTDSDNKKKRACMKKRVRVSVRKKKARAGKKAVKERRPLTED